MPVVVYDNIPARAGYVRDSGGVKTAFSGPAINPSCGRSPSPAAPPILEYRSYHSFDTSSIPTTATVYSVRVYLIINSFLTAGANPVQWRHRLYFGDIIGAALDIGDWTGGTNGLNHAWPGMPTAGWLAAATSIASLVNKGGYTDLMMTDWSNYIAPTTLWTVNWENKGSIKLEVGYQLPNRAVRIT